MGSYKKFVLTAIFVTVEQQVLEQDENNLNTGGV